MITPELVAYIKEQLQNGLATQVVAQALSDQGWAAGDIRDGFEAANKQVTPDIAPPPTPTAIGQVPDMRTATSGQKTVVLALGGLTLLLLIGGAAAFGYTRGYFTFGAPYKENQLLSGIVSALATIEAATYTIEGSFTMEEREADAAPFVFVSEGGADFEERYGRDVERVSSIRKLKNYLEYHQRDNQSYPATLDTVLGNRIDDFESLDIVITDPLTKQPFDYVVTKGGQGYSLTVTLETDTAAALIVERGNRFITSTEAVAPVITGKTITVTPENASQLGYLSSRPPQPMLNQLIEGLQFAPPQMRILLALTAAADTRPEITDWKFNVNVEGDFDDLLFKINADALKSGQYYYARINNLPSLYEGFIPVPKGTWVSFAASTTKDISGYGSLGAITALPREYDNEMKAYTEELRTFSRKAITIADEIGLLSLRTPAHIESVDGRRLYRYDLMYNKDAIKTFYDRLQTEAKKYESLEANDLFNDPSITRYLESDEFNATSDYLAANMSFIVWVDHNGMPEIIEYRLRMVPPDSVERLADRQGVLSVRLLINDVNKNIPITAPAEATPLEELPAFKATREAREKGRMATIKQTLSSLRSRAEIYYNANGFSYKGLCASADFNELVAYVVKEDDQVALTKEEKKASTYQCNDTATAWAFAVPLPNLAGKVGCVDSTGYVGDQDGGLSSGSDYACAN